MKHEYWINVTHADNRLVIYLDGEIIWDSNITHDDPDMNHFINITEGLEEHSKHTNELIFEGFNDHYGEKHDDGDFNYWHFTYRVFRRDINDAGEVVGETDILEPFNERHLSNPNITAIENLYQIVLKDGKYKVTQNSLKKNFYK